MCGFPTPIMGGFNWSSQRLWLGSVEVVVMSGGRPSLPRGVRVAFWQAVRAGVPVREAGVAVGAGRVAEDWFRRAGGVAANGPGPVGGRYLSLAEREEIAVGVAAGEPLRVIAARLGRAPATVSREVRRNANARGRYRAVAAQAQAEARARRPKTAKLAGNRELRQWVQEKLGQRWSPEQVSAALRVEFAGRPEMRVSHETIYQAIYVQGRGALRRELAVSLRTGRALRRPRRAADARRGRIKDMVMISERPAEAADRAVPGHWEGDLIIGTGSSAIGTLVERTTRFVLLLHLPAGHDAAAVAAAMTEAMAALPAQLRRSLAWDQGKEMAAHQQVSVATGLAVYFCDPHSPWQRGSNENTNGLLRQYFPKRTDLRQHSREQLEAVAAELNARPRKTLGWKTPAQALEQILAEAA
jgi:IS30 family transposase